MLDTAWLRTACSRTGMDRSSVTGAILTVAVTGIIVSVLLVHREAPVEAAPAAGIPGCSNIQVLITPTNKGLGAAAGSIGRWYRMHDIWGGPCSLRGFPGVELLDRNFHTLPGHVRRGHGMIISGDLLKREVVLNQQHDAYFALEYSDVQSDGEPCGSVPYLMVTPPNDKLPVVTYSGGIVPCPGQITVSPVEPVPLLR